MARNRLIPTFLRLAAAFAALSSVWASEHHGTVKSGGLPVPGATVTATNGDHKVVTTTDENGVYSFRDLPDGIWNIEISMLGFATAKKEIGVMASAPTPEWELKLMSPAEVKAALAPPAAPTEAPKPAATTTAATAASAPTAAPPAAQPAKPAAPQANGGNANGSRPSLRQAMQNQQQRGAAFQRLDVNQSGDLSAAGAEGAMTNEMATDLGSSASESMLLQGSVSQGLGMPGVGDWGRMEGMAMMMGGAPGMGPGMNGMPGDNNNGDNPMGLQAGGRGGAGGPGGPGGRGGPGGGPMMGGGPGGFGGGFGGPGGFGGRGGPGGFGGRGGPGARGGRAGGRAGMMAFGNARRDRRQQYNGNLGFIFGNSVWDAQSYSVTGNQVAKPAYANARATMMFGGPLKIPHILPYKGAMFTINYQLSRSRNGTTANGTVPTLLERSGNFSESVGQNQRPVTIYDPTNGAPFVGNIIPDYRIDAGSKALLNLFPLPNFPGGVRNYSRPISTVSNQDNINTRISNVTFSKKDRLNGGFSYQGGNGATPNLFGFIDDRSSRGMNANVSYTHNFTTRVINNLSYQFSRQRSLASPFFAYQYDVASGAGILGASSDPRNWGPPNLSFTQNISSLSDGSASLNRNQTSSVSESLIWVHNLHNMTFGASYRRQQINPLSDSNARGAFAFTGNGTSLIQNGIAVQGTGYDFADFLLGHPDTASVNYGNPDKYFRTSAYSVFANDDWRISTKFTLNFGLRWDYQAPVTELYNRLVNLDVAPGFTAVAQVLPGQVGPLTGIQYPDSLIHSSPHNFSPRVGFAWRPFPKHSTRINGGYGINYLSSIYTAFANNMAAQPPFATNLSVSVLPTSPLTIHNALLSATSLSLTNTRAIDPNYVIGYAQSFQLSIQQDLGRALVGTLTPAGPSGYYYQQSNANSSYNSVQAAVMRRFRSGISANVSYIFSKWIDNTGVAQNWLDLNAERALDSGDARHTMNASWQYSSGVGRAGGTLLKGWKGAALKDWTFTNSITLRTGSPLTAVAGGNRAVVGGTGITGTVRADATGQPLYPAVDGYGFNLAAFAPPVTGEWGNAARNTITGPAIFSLNGALGRVFRIGERKNIDLRFDVSNALNHPTITSWGSTVSSATFGLPTAASQMRRMTANLRFRF